MQTLKESLMQASVLVSLDFSASALGIELGIDASTTVGWGTVLSQYRDDAPYKVREWDLVRCRMEV
jgi:hypothetical protein